MFLGNILPRHEHPFKIKSKSAKTDTANRTEITSLEKNALNFSSLNCGLLTDFSVLFNLPPSIPEYIYIHEVENVRNTSLW